jgi:cell division protein FtsB
MRDAWHTSGSIWGGVLLMGVAVLTVAICRGDALFVNYFTLKQDRKQLEEKIQALEERNDLLKQQEKLLQSSPEYAKKVLREKYNYREENEEIIFVPN